MNWADYETLGFLDFKSEVIAYLQQRAATLSSEKAQTEYEYCELRGRLKELESLKEFLETTTLKSKQQKLNNNLNNLNNLKSEENE